MQLFRFFLTWFNFPFRAGGEVWIFGFYDNKQTNKKMSSHTPCPLQVVSIFVFLSSNLSFFLSFFGGERW